MTDLQQIARRCFQDSIDLPQQFFADEAEKLSQACLQMAKRFHKGGRLLAFGAGNSITDAQHISVEFVHPVIVGKRALPAIALGTDVSATIGTAQRFGWDAVYARQIQAIGRTDDIAIGIDPSGQDVSVINGLKKASDMGLLTIALTGKTMLVSDCAFAVPSDNQAIIQEIHETLYHILWELVHVFFEHKALLEV